MILNIYKFGASCNTLSCVQEKINIIIKFDIGSQNTKHDFVSKATQDVYLNPNLQHLGIQYIWKVHSKNKLHIDSVFDK